MIEITSAEAKAILLKNEAQNAELIDGINWHEREKIDAQYFSAYGTLIITGSFRGNIFTDVISNDSGFDMEGICDWLANNRTKGSVSITLHRPTHARRTAIAERLSATHSFSRKRNRKSPTHQRLKDSLLPPEEGVPHKAL